MIREHIRPALFTAALIAGVGLGVPGLAQAGADGPRETGLIQVSGRSHHKQHGESHPRYRHHRQHHDRHRYREHYGHHHDPYYVLFKHRLFADRYDHHGHYDRDDHYRRYRY